MSSRTRDRAEPARTYYGRAACAALLTARAEAIERVFVDEERAPPDVVRQLMRLRHPYRAVGSDELDKLAQSRHHEGVVVFATAPVWPTWDELMAEAGPAQFALVDAGLNPHNLGAIFRSAAQFGVRAIGAVGGHPAVAGAAARIAEGAVESVPYARVDDPKWACRVARDRGFVLAATDATAEIGLFGWRAPEDRVVWLLGQEGRGLSPELCDQASVTLSIPGTGAVESLNVSVAAALTFAEGYRVRLSPSRNDA